MSGTRPRVAPRRPIPRAQLPLLDRLLDDIPEHGEDTPLSPADVLELLCGSVKRDLEALLNAPRPFQPVPPHYPALRTSPLGYGIPDVMAATTADPRRRESLRQEIEDTIRRFEPRLTGIRVLLLENEDKLEPTLRLRIEALLRAEPAPESVAFDTIVEVTTSNVVVQPSRNV